MTMFQTVFAMCATVALAACTSGEAEQSGPDALAKTSYQCTDGSVVEAVYPTPDTARIVHLGRTTELTLAVSASGARYVGDGLQWWTKGATEAMLSLSLIHI